MLMQGYYAPFGVKVQLETGGFKTEWDKALNNLF